MIDIVVIVAIISMTVECCFAIYAIHSMFKHSKS